MDASTARPATKPHFDANILRIAAVCGIVAQVAFVVLWLVWAFISGRAGPGLRAARRRVMVLA